MYRRDDGPVVDVEGDEGIVRVRLSSIREAATQPDTGDGLVPVYRALLRQAWEQLDASRS